MKHRWDCVAGCSRWQQRAPKYGNVFEIEFRQIRLRENWFSRSKGGASRVLDLLFFSRAEGLDRAIQLLACFASEEQLGDLLTPKKLFLPIPFHVPLDRFFKSRGRGKAIARVSHGMLRLFLLGFLAPQLLFFFGELVPAVADDAADVAMVVFDGLGYFFFGPELGAEDHEGVAGSRDAVT